MAIGRGEFSENTARFTGWRTGDIVADSQKKRLNSLFAILRFDEADHFLVVDNQNNAGSAGDYRPVVVR